MNRREAKREACQVVAALIHQALHEPGSDGGQSNVFDPTWTDAEATRFSSAMEELAAELSRRGNR